MLQFIQDAEQLKIIDAGDEAIASVRSEGFARHRPLFTAVRFDVLGWADQLDAVVMAAREAYTVRAHGDDVYQDESREVRDLVERFEKWYRRLVTAARAIESSDHTLAPKVIEMFKVRDFSGGSAENVHGNLPGLLLNVVELGDLSELGLPPSFVEEAKDLLAAFRGQRHEAWEAKVRRVDMTGELHRLLDAIVQLMERFARYREFAMVMADKEIPELGLAVLRSSLAPRPAPAAAPVEADAQAPVPPLAI